MGEFDIVVKGLRGKAKTLSEITMEHARVWNLGKDKLAEEYGQKEVVFLSDVLAVLGDLQKTMEELFQRFPKLRGYERLYHSRREIVDWKRDFLDIVEGKALKKEPQP